MMKTRFSKCPAAQPTAFTLVELMVSMVVLSIILSVSVQVVGQTQKAWRRGVAQMEQFREARAAFESITNTLKQAVLNTYLTYEYHSGPNSTVPENKDQVPQRYIRQSELQFVTGQATDLVKNNSSGILATHAIFFQARLGVSDRDGYEALSKLLCGRGYFIMRSDDDAYRPAPVSQRRTRFRLWEYRPTSEGNTVYSGVGVPWYSDAIKSVVQASDTVDNPSPTRPLAENIIALVISPQVTPDDVEFNGKKTDWIAPNYAYDSRLANNVSTDNPQGTQHLLPPVVVVTMVAIDEASARSLEERYNNAPPQLVPATAFKNAELMASDLKALEAKLVQEKLNFRVFTTSITLRNSKWGLLK
jgi:uncharacterized protein (TIGR02599 family)